MANHMLNAFIERKRQLWAEIEATAAYKELKIIETLEHNMAHENSDNFTTGAKTIPKREPLPIQRKIVQGNPFDLLVKSAVKTASSVEEVVKNAGGLQIFYDYAKRITNNQLFRVTNQPREKRAYLILVDGTNRNKSGAFKTKSIAIFDSKKEAYEMRDKLYDYLRENWHLNANN